MKHLEKFNFFDIFKRKNQSQTPRTFGDKDFEEFFKSVDHVIEYGIDRRKMNELIDDCFLNIKDIGCDIRISNREGSANPVLPKDFEASVDIRIIENNITLEEFEKELKYSIGHLDGYGMYISSNFIRYYNDITDFNPNGVDLYCAFTNFNNGHDLDLVNLNFMVGRNHKILLNIKMKG